jgi:hypothetical protein
MTNERGARPQAGHPEFDTQGVASDTQGVASDTQGVALG